jgi:hypothetical protein
MVNHGREKGLKCFWPAVSLVFEPDIKAELHPSHHIDCCERVCGYLLLKLYRLGGIPSGSEVVELICEGVYRSKESVEQDPVVVQDDADFWRQVVGRWTLSADDCNVMRSV